MKIEVRKGATVGRYDGYIDGVKTTGNFTDSVVALRKTKEVGVELKLVQEWIEGEFVDGEDI